jgi:carbohydrate-selective porin OprB
LDSKEGRQRPLKFTRFSQNRNESAISARYLLSQIALLTGRVYRDSLGGLQAVHLFFGGRFQSAVHRPVNLPGRGDGGLKYGREDIVEAYYNLHVWRGLFSAFDLQHINHPGYNRDRGPVLVPGLRFHLEF